MDHFPVGQWETLPAYPWPTEEKNRSKSPSSNAHAPTPTRGGGGASFHWTLQADPPRTHVLAPFLPFLGAKASRLGMGMRVGMSDPPGAGAGGSRVPDSSGRGPP